MPSIPFAESPERLTAKCECGHALPIGLQLAQPGSSVGQVTFPDLSLMVSCGNCGRWHMVLFSRFGGWAQESDGQGGLERHYGVIQPFAPELDAREKN